jgi:hypothetical protein
MNLASLLSLPPLSKIQVSSKAVIRDASAFGTPMVLPFWFFQCEREGLLELRSPGGYMTRVSPLDVCDVVLADPLIVDAMPRARFLQRLSLSPQERLSSHGAHLFEPAHAMWVAKDKWGRVDAVHVRFVDGAFNDVPGPIGCGVSDESRAFLNTVAKRDRLPVAKYGDRASSCSLSRERPEYRKARQAFSSLVRSSVNVIRPSSAGHVSA